MFDDVSRQLTTWATAQGAAEVCLSGEAPATAQAAAQLTLLGLLPYPPPRSLTRAPLRFRLRYLVTCSAEAPPAAQALLGRLLVSALQEPEFQVELGDIAPELWTALGWRPQPAFSLILAVTVALDQPPVPLAREHVLRVQASPRVWRRGTVTDAQGRPVAGARVELEGTGEPLYTDQGGHFEVAARPGDTLHVAAVVAGQVRQLEARSPDTPGEWPVQLPGQP